MMIILPVHLSNSFAVAMNNYCTICGAPEIKAGKSLLNCGSLTYYRIPFAKFTSWQNEPKKKIAVLYQRKKGSSGIVWLQSLTTPWHLKHQQYHTGKVMWLNYAYLCSRYSYQATNLAQMADLSFLTRKIWNLKTSLIFLLYTKPNKHKIGILKLTTVQW